MFWQEATSRLAQTTFGAVSLHRAANLLRRCKTNPDRATRFSPARLNQHAAARRAKAPAHKKKLRALGQSLNDYWD